MKPRKVLKYHSFLYGLGKLVVETDDGIRGWTTENSRAPFCTIYTDGRKFHHRRV